MPDPTEIAARRFELITILIDPAIDEAERRVALRKLLAKPVEWPGSKARGEPPIRKRITKSTLYRWARLFREHGYEGLIPKSRKDRGVARCEGAGTWLTFAIALLYEQRFDWWPLIPGGVLILLGLPDTRRAIRWVFDQWPVLLIVIGVMILLGAFRRPASRKRARPDA